MANNTTSGLCRLSIRTPRNGFELALPIDIPLADLMPTLLGYAGPGLGEAGLEHEGWILQRLGEKPFDPERTPESLGLHDGETVYLRPRQEALPPVDFDDLVDGISTEMKSRGDSWRPELTRNLLRTLTMVALGVSLTILALPGAHGPRELAAGLIVLLLLAGAASSSRAMGDGVTAAYLGVASVPFLALAGLLIPAGGQGDVLLGARIVAGATASAGGAGLALAAVAVGAPLFLGIAVVALLGTAGGTVMMIWAIPTPAAAGVVAVLAVALGWFVPALAFRLSGLRLPLLPVNAEQLQEDIEPHSGGDVRSRSQVADSYLTALYLAIGSTCTVCLTAALSSSAWSSTVFAVVLCVLLLSQSRKLGGMWQRFALVLPGAYGAVLLCVAITLRGDAGQRMVVLGGVLALAATMTVANWTVPRRRLLPYWGRIADLIESLAAISLVPLAVLALGVFGYLRGMGG